MRTNEEILEEIHTIKNHKTETIARYKGAVKRYCEFNEMTLNELIMEAEHEEEQGIRWKHRKLKSRLINFRQYLLENYTSGSMKAYIQPIIVIYKYFEVELQSLPEITKQSMKNSRPITFKDLPDKQVIREALAIASPIMRAVILFMTSSGCARAETLSLTILDYMNAVKEYYSGSDIMEMIDTINKMDSVIPTFSILRIKTNKYYTTYCSHEAVQAINSYLLSRHDPLTLESKLFKINPNIFTVKFGEINDELGLGKVGTYNRFRSHMLRKFHASALYNDGMGIDKVDELQGRSKDSTHQSYFMENPEDLKFEYLEHINVLLMSKEVEKVTVKSPEYLKMEQKLHKKTEEVESMNDRLSAIENILSDSGLPGVMGKFKK